MVKDPVCGMDVDEKKQSYFLFSLSQEKLKYCFFPLGDYTKEEVRKMDP